MPTMPRSLGGSLCFSTRRMMRFLSSITATPISDRRLDLILCLADENADVADAGIHHALHGVKQHRLVANGHQLFGARVGNWPQPCGQAARENERFQWIMSGRSSPTATPGPLSRY